MKEPAKIETYIKIMKEIEKWSPSCMIGFDELSEQKQEKLYELSAAISNRINIIDEDEKTT